ncbi:MAG TPA: hypothetical protein G4N94_12105 [Caldilineae bacterium]|nr:hypothetical protein [Caldilineae bacterium]
MSTTATKRINVTFPLDVLEDLRDLIPKRERNKFIVKAVETAIRHESWGQVLAELREEGPIWKAEDHPDMLTSEDIDRWVRNLREASMPRTWDELLAENEEDTATKSIVGQENTSVRQPA